MELLRVRLVTEGEQPGGGKRKVHIAVHRSYAYLADLLGKAFAGQSDVEIVVDPNMGDRGPSERSAPPDPRPGTAAAPRRASKQKVPGKKRKDEQSGKPVSKPDPESA